MTTSPDTIWEAITVLEDRFGHQDHPFLSFVHALDEAGLLRQDMTEELSRWPRSAGCGRRTRT